MALIMWLQKSFYQKKRVKEPKARGRQQESMYDDMCVLLSTSKKLKRYFSVLALLYLLSERDYFPVALNHNCFSANSKAGGIEDVIKIVLDMRGVHPVGGEKVGNTVLLSTTLEFTVLHNLQRQYIKTLIRTAAKCTGFTVRILNNSEIAARWTVFPLSSESLKSSGDSKELLVLCQCFKNTF